MASDNIGIVPDGPGRVAITGLPMPVLPLGDDVRVRMMLAPVNPADLLVIDGRYAFDLGASAVIGAEGVGIVDAVGPLVPDLHPGERVLPLSRGNWCRYKMMPRSELIALPAHIDLEQSAMMRINPPTASLLLERARVGAGDVILQNGATSTVARWVRAIAGRKGIVVIDVARRADAALAHAVVDGPGLADRVRAILADRRLRAALDCVAGAATGRLAECLAPSGRLIVFGHLSGEPIRVRSQLLTGRDLSISGFSLRPAEADLDVAARDCMFAGLFALHTASELRSRVRDILPLSRIDDALATARRAGLGRVLIDLTE